MTRNIVEIFYENGGYTSGSDFIGQDSYIAPDEVTGSYVPQGLTRFNRLCAITASYDTTSFTSSDKIYDTIIAELALSIADSEYDKIHIDPETGVLENKHYDSARRYMLDIFGIPVKLGTRMEFLLPAEVTGAYNPESKAADNMEIASMSS